MSTRPTFEHRHFKLIADVIARMNGELTRGDIALAFASRLSDTNPNFNRERFIAASKGTPTNGRDRIRAST